MASPLATIIKNKDCCNNISKEYYLFLFFNSFYLYYLFILFT